MSPQPTKGYTRTDLPWCLGLFPIDNGQHEDTNRLLAMVLVPHERPHGIMRTLENPCMLLPLLSKALKMRAAKGIVTLVANNIGCTKLAAAQLPLARRGTL